MRNGILRIMVEPSEEGWAVGKHIVDRAQVVEFIDSLLGQDLHAKRVRSLADAATGVVTAGALGVHAIGRGLAAAAGTVDKHAIKQVDRLLSNEAVVVWDIFDSWAKHCIGERVEVIVNMDWTEFDQDDHSMIVLSLQTNHGRATPLIWKSVVKSKLKDSRNDAEDEVLFRLKQVLPATVRKVTIVADRGFGDRQLYELLKEVLGFEHIIRFRGVVYVTNSSGEVRKASEWLQTGGRLRVLRDVRVTADGYPLASFVAVHERGMKDAWFLAVSDPGLKGVDAKKIYGKRFTCEETFRDVKDRRFGMGMKWARIADTDRRDRMMLLAAFAHVLLTLLGAAGERAGLDRLLKANTSKRRSLSLFRQGLRWYELLPNMREDRLKKLLEAFVEIMREHEVCRTILGVL